MRLVLVPSAILLLVLACNPDDRGGFSPCITSADRLPVPPGYVCSFKRYCSLRSDMMVSCAADNYCDCNLPDGRYKRFKSKLGCADELAFDDECEAEP